MCVSETLIFPTYLQNFDVKDAELENSITDKLCKIEAWTGSTYFKTQVKCVDTKCGLNKMTAIPLTTIPPMKGQEGTKNATSS